MDLEHRKQQQGLIRKEVLKDYTGGKCTLLFVFKVIHNLGDIHTPLEPPLQQ